MDMITFSGSCFGEAGVMVMVLGPRDQEPMNKASNSLWPYERARSRAVLSEVSRIAGSARACKSTSQQSQLPSRAAKWSAVKPPWSVKSFNQKVWLRVPTRGPMVGLMVGSLLSVEDISDHDHDHDLATFGKVILLAALTLLLISALC